MKSHFYTLIFKGDNSYYTHYYIADNIKEVYDRFIEEYGEYEYEIISINLMS